MAAKTSVALVPLDVAEFDGHYYSTLDLVPVTSNGFGILRQYMPLREGWELAPNKEGLVTAMTKFHWGGAACIILADGSAYSLRGDNRGQCLRAGGALMSAGGAHKPVVNIGDARILIRTSKAGGERVSPASYCDEINGRLWKKRRFTDFTIVCQGQEIPCHRAVLAEASPMFESALSNGMREASEGRLEVRDAEPEVVKAMLSFLYTGKLEDEALEHPSLLAVGDFYGVDALVRACAERLMDKLCPQNIMVITRALKGLKDKPDFAPLWASLQDMLSKDKQLLSALMASS